VAEEDRYPFGLRLAIRCESERAGVTMILHRPDVTELIRAAEI